MCIYQRKDNNVFCCLDFLFFLKLAFKAVQCRLKDLFGRERQRAQRSLPSTLVRKKRVEDLCS